MGGFPLVPLPCKGGVRGGFSFKILKIPPQSPLFKRGEALEIVFGIDLVF